MLSSRSVYKIPTLNSRNTLCHDLRVDGGFRLCRLRIGILESPLLIVPCRKICTHVGHCLGTQLLILGKYLNMKKILANDNEELCTSSV